MSKNENSKVKLKQQPVMEQNNYREFLETINEMLFVISKKGEIVYKNKAAIEITGYSYEELSNIEILNLESTFAKEISSNILGELNRKQSINASSMKTLNNSDNILSELNHKQSINASSMKILNKNGDEINIALTAWHSVWNGKPHIFCSMRNLSETQSLNDKLEHIVRLAPSWTILMTYPDRKVVSINDMFSNRFAILEEDIIGRKPEDLGFRIKALPIEEYESCGAKTEVSEKEVSETEVSEKDKSEKEVEFAEILAKEKYVSNVKCLLTTAAGEEIPVLYFGVVFNSLDVDYCIEIFVNISDICAAKDNLENIIKEKDKFFSIIAHDLKGAIGGLAASAGNFARNMTNMTLQEMQETTDALKTSSASVYSLLENLLEWSRVQRDLITFNVDFTSLSIITKTIVDALAAAAKVKKVNIINNISEGTFIMADANMLSTILRNLISNSLKFTNANGIISVNMKEDNKYYKISVKDTGIGMPEEISKNLFRVDKKVSRPGTAGETSTGLGLILCHEYVEKHKGRIWAESKVDEGTTFHFTISKNIILQDSLC